MNKAKDDQIEVRLQQLPDKEVCAIYLAAKDGEKLTREEELALGEMERRELDW